MSGNPPVPAASTSTAGPAPIAESSDIRTDIVGILSNTVNGCLAELGYFPGIVQRLHILDEQHKRLLADNQKLYSDNRELARLVGLQNERFATINIPERNKLAYIESLKRDVSSLQSERTALIQRDNAILSGLSRDHGYQMLYTDLQQTQKEHNAALAEIAYLRNRVHAYESMYGVMGQDGRKKSANVANGRSVSQPGHALPGVVYVPPQTPGGTHEHVTQTHAQPVSAAPAIQTTRTPSATIASQSRHPSQDHTSPINEAVYTPLPTGTGSRPSTIGEMQTQPHPAPTAPTPSAEASTVSISVDSGLTEYIQSMSDAFGVPHTQRADGSSTLAEPPKDDMIIELRQEVPEDEHLANSRKRKLGDVASPTSADILPQSGPALPDNVSGGGSTEAPREEGSEPIDAEMEDGVGDEDEEVEVEVDVEADREYFLQTIFNAEDPATGLHTCGLCERRNEQGLGGPSSMRKEERAEHCEREHPAAWSQVSYIGGR